VSAHFQVALIESGSAGKAAALFFKSLTHGS
jgi:hypothetical protein